MFTLTINLDASVTHEDAHNFMEDIVASLPVTDGTISRTEELINADALTEKHKGATVSFIDDRGWDVQGRLDAILPTTSPATLGLVISGVLHTVTLGVVRIIS